MDRDWLHILVEVEDNLVAVGDKHPGVPAVGDRQPGVPAEGDRPQQAGAGAGSEQGMEPQLVEEGKRQQVVELQEEVVAGLHQDK